jgi:hypothetical protein
MAPGVGQKMETSMAEKRRKRHSPAQIISRLREADAGLNAGDSLAAVLQKLQVSGESTGAVRVAAAGEGKNRPVSAPVTVEDALATEGADPVDTGSFRFERSGPRVDVALPIRYELSGTAVNGVDYEQLSGRHVFAPQQTSSLVEVVMLEDDEVEPDEEIQVALQGNPTGLVSAGLGNAVAVVTGQAKIRAKGQIDEFAPAVVDMSSRPPGNMAELIVWRTDQRAFWVYEGGVPTPLGASPAVTNAELRIVDQSRIIATNELEVIFEWTGPVRQEGREWSYRIQLCDATQVRPAAPLWVIVKVF